MTQEEVAALLVARGWAYRLPLRPKNPHGKRERCTRSITLLSVNPCLYHQECRTPTEVLRHRGRRGLERAHAQRGTTCWASKSSSICWARIDDFILHGVAALPQSRLWLDFNGNSVGTRCASSPASSPGRNQAAGLTRPSGIPTAPSTTVLRTPVTNVASASWW